MSMKATDRLLDLTQEMESLENRLDLIPSNSPEAYKIRKELKAIIRQKIKLESEIEDAKHAIRELNFDHETLDRCASQEGDFD
jgi:predicted RNase H-like nuclease (RuvC/YqgF family)